MRFGSVLLIVGLLLCLSIAWAALGFFMMGIGLLCMLIAEERKRRILKVPAPFVVQSDTYSLAPVDLLAPPTFSKSLANSSFDRHEWETLVEHDTDLARLVEVMTPYGKKYVDQLARMYFDRPDKSFLPVIIDKIIEAAARDAGKEVSVQPTATGLLRSGKSFFASTETTQQNRDTSLRAIYAILLDNPRSKLTVSAVEGGGAPVSHVKRHVVPKARSATNGQTSPAASAEMASHFDIDPSLLDLLGRLEPKAGGSTEQIVKPV